MSRLSCKLLNLILLNDRLISFEKCLIRQECAS